MHCAKLYVSQYRTQVTPMQDSHTCCPQITSQPHTRLATWHVHQPMACCHARSTNAVEKPTLQLVVTCSSLSCIRAKSWSWLRLVSQFSEATTSCWKPESTTACCAREPSQYAQGCHYKQAHVSSQLRIYACHVGAQHKKAYAVACILLVVLPTTAPCC